MLARCVIMLKKCAYKTGRQMPDNPNTWLEATRGLPPWLAGFVMAITLAILRALYDGRGKKTWAAWTIETLLDSAICGAICIPVGNIILESGYSQNWALMSGAVIGLIGAKSVRGIVLRIIEKKS